MYCLRIGMTAVVITSALYSSWGNEEPPTKKQAADADVLATALEGVPDLDNTSRYLQRVIELRRRQQTVGKSGQSGASDFLAQVLATEETALGRHYDAIRLMDNVSSTPSGPKSDTGLVGYAPKDAAKTIIELAARHQVVMINEAHHVARHRAFVTLLLAGLYEKGFRYFAAEAFLDDDMPDLTKRGYPSLETGGYCTDPVFGDLIRQALRLGYKPIAYEHYDDKPQAFQRGDEEIRREIAEREEGEARNLKQRIFDKDPKARVVVLAGYSHVRKVSEVTKRDGKKSEITWMAARFKKLTGINPLTIDQTTVMEHVRTGCEHPAYRLAVEEKKVTDQSVVLFGAKSGQYYVPPAYSGAFDLVVFHPRDLKRDTRPRWLRMGGYRREVKVAELPPPPKDGSLLAQAFAKGEKVELAIPVDQVEYGPAEWELMFLLPTGEYTLRVVGATGLMVHERNLKVE
jgi:hypothetical protein